MFRKYTAWSVLLVACLSLASLASLFFVRKSDKDQYKKILQDQASLSTKSLPETAQQTRQGVRKDIWFSQEDSTRLHYRIESESSLLTLVPNKSKFDVVENLQKIKCWMQEKLYLADNKSPMQQVRFLQAEEGIYRYNLQQFGASSVGLSLFRLPGHALTVSENQQKAFLQGRAEDVSFAVSGKTPQFTAHNFKAILKQEENP